MRISQSKRKLCFAADITQGREIQEFIRKNVRQRCGLKYSDTDLAAGCDVSYTRDGTARAAVVVYSRRKKKFVEEVSVETRARFPYVSTYLSFREAPALLEALEKLESEPEVFIFDGQGSAHPRGAGLACHMGVVLEKPSVGCAKSRLWGIIDDPPQVKGAYTFIKDKHGALYGVCMRTRGNVKPLYISTGWGVDIPFIIDAVGETLGKFRLPELMRRAHELTQKGSVRGRKK